jgi:hypothetical protein
MTRQVSRLIEMILPKSTGVAINTTSHGIRLMRPSHHCGYLPQPGSSEIWRVRRYTEDFQLSNDAILARHMHLLNDKLESFMNDLASERVI